MSELNERPKTQKEMDLIGTLPLPPSRRQPTALDLLDQLLYEESMENIIRFLQCEARGIKQKPSRDLKKEMKELDEWHAKLIKLTTK